MKKTFYFSCLLLLWMILPWRISAQIKDDISFTNTEIVEISFQEDIEGVVAEIADIIQLNPDRFIIRADERVGNVKATLEGSKQVIPYNPHFMKAQLQQNSWTAKFMLAHEMGHLLNGDLTERASHELEFNADKFATNILCRMGASSKDIEACFATCPDIGDASHPGRAARIAAALKNFEKDECEKGNPISSCSDALEKKYAAEYGGFAVGMCRLGWMYATGRRGLFKDEIKAVEWYRKSADAGSAAGMNNLGLMYATGRGGLTKDEVKAVEWYRKSAEGGSGVGMCNLGGMYETGRGGVTKDKDKALEWYRKSADLGNEDAKAAIKRLEH